MSLKLFNTLTRKKETFEPLVKGKVGMYTCGPTVYNYVHIGNLRAYVAQDLLKRYLKYKGYSVKHVMNITDVEDKIIRDCQKQGKSLSEFTRSYEDEFYKDIAAVNVQKADIIPRATEHITEMVQLVKQLEKNKHTYVKNGSTYFKISSLPSYGRIAHLDFSQLKENADGRIDSDEYEKEDARDFVLWKAYAHEDGKVSWDTELGKGRPGWHIECSAMSTKYLGESFDIHCGGVDLIFPHHTNEIAQTEGATGKPFVKYWVHNEHLLVDGQKMSKSLGNFFTLRDLLKKGYDPLAIRFELMSTHYRQQLNFTFGSLDSVPNTLNRLYEFMDNVAAVAASTGDDSAVDAAMKKASEGFEEAMDDDLNISGALGAVFDFVREVNSMIAWKKVSVTKARDVMALMERFDSVLGLLKEKEKIPEEVIALAEKRLDARKRKDWKGSDRLREEIAALGYKIDDTAEGYRVKKS